jgi:hypothetical protein
VPTLTVVLSAWWILFAPQGAQRPPDFSGSWIFDAQKTMKPDADGRVVLAAMLGDEFTALQTDTSLTLRIVANGQLVVAIYDLSGKPTKNVSPGDVDVTSWTRWKGDRLIITSASVSDDNGKATKVETTRVLWIDDAGDLILERTGRPETHVTPSRSVYRRTRSRLRADADLEQ